MLHRTSPASNFSGSRNPLGGSQLLARTSPCAHKHLGATQAYALENLSSFAAGSPGLSGAWSAFLPSSFCVLAFTCSKTPLSIGLPRELTGSLPALSSSPWRSSFSTISSNLGEVRGRERIISGAGNSREIPVVEDPPVMQLVPRGDKGEGPDGHFIFVGHAAPAPGLFPQ